MCPPWASLYWNFRDEIGVVDGVFFKGDRVIVPQSLRKEMLEELHESHQGIVRSKQRAREVMY